MTTCQPFFVPISRQSDHSYISVQRTRRPRSSPAFGHSAALVVRLAPTLIAGTPTSKHLHDHPLVLLGVRVYCYPYGCCYCTCNLQPIASLIHSKQALQQKNRISNSHQTNPTPPRPSFRSLCFLRTSRPSFYSDTKTSISLSFTLCNLARRRWSFLSNSFVRLESTCILARACIGSLSIP